MEWTATVLTAVLGLVLAGVVAIVGAVWNLRSYVEKMLSALAESMREESRRVEKEAKEDRRRVEKEAKEERRRVEKEAKEDRREIKAEMERRLVEAKEDRRQVEKEAKEERREIKAEMERRLVEAKEDRREIEKEAKEDRREIKVRISRLEAPYFRKGAAEDGEEEADDGLPGESSGPSSSQSLMAAKGG